MLSRLEIDGNNWHVLNANHPLCSETEVWRYTDWQNWTDSSSSSKGAGASSSRSRSRGAALDVFFPAAVEHVLFPGCSHK
jgi:hypothetical protein